MKIAKYLFLFFFSLSSCKGQDVFDCRSLNKFDGSETYQKLLSKENEIIPCLIKQIDIEEEGKVAFINPSSSHLYSYMFSNKLGINYAYYIDYILSMDSVETVNKIWNENEDFYHWEEITKPYRIYNAGVIVKQDGNNNPILEPLSHADMVNIKKMYTDWWEKNKEKSIETLREEFKNGNKILQLPYVWI